MAAITNMMITERSLRRGQQDRLRYHQSKICQQSKSLILYLTLSLNCRLSGDLLISQCVIFKMLVHSSNPVNGVVCGTTIPGWCWFVVKRIDATTGEICNWDRLWLTTKWTQVQQNVLEWSWPFQDKTWLALGHKSYYTDISVMTFYARNNSWGTRNAIRRVS